MTIKSIDRPRIIDSQKKVRECYVLQRAKTLSENLSPANKQRIKNHDAERQIYQELQALHARNQDITAHQSNRQHRSMNKLSWLFIFIIFLLMASLFFISGFITCYITYPPRPINLTSNTDYTQPISPIQNAFDNNTTIIDNQTNSKSYSYRQKLLKSLNGKQAQSYLLDAENQAKNQTSEVVRNAFGHVLDQWSENIRSALGPFFGGAVVPLSTGLAHSVVDDTLSPTYGTDFNTYCNRNMPNQSSSIPQEPAVPAVTGHYSIQIQNFDDSNAALDLANELKAKNYGAYVVRMPTTNGLQFSVRAGSFSNYRAAQAAASTLTRMWNQPTRVIMIDQNDAKLSSEKAGS